MAHCFVELLSGNGAETPPDDAHPWAIATLDGRAFALDGDEKTTLRPRHLGARARGGESSARRDAAAPILMRSGGDGEPERWIVLGEPAAGLRVNGRPLVTGVRVLRHKDEVRRCGVAGRIYFSVEELCCVAPFEGPAGTICPRCQQPIESGSGAVRCPQCHVFHHESAELHCWTYAPTCSFDDQPTDLHAGFRWSPGGRRERG